MLLKSYATVLKQFVIWKLLEKMWNVCERVMDCLWVMKKRFGIIGMSMEQLSGLCVGFVSGKKYLKQL